MRTETIKSINKKLIQFNVKLVKGKKYYTIEGEGAKDWKYNKIYYKSMSIISDWVDAIKKLKEINRRIIKRENCHRLINSAMKSELSQDSSLTGHYFTDDCMGYWSNMINLIESY